MCETQYYKSLASSSKIETVVKSRKSSRKSSNRESQQTRVDAFKHFKAPHDLLCKSNANADGHSVVLLVGKILLLRFLRSLSLTTNILTCLESDATLQLLDEEKPGHKLDLCCPGAAHSQ